VWAELVGQSMGGLHVFLPLRDLGIDGVVAPAGDGCTSRSGAGQDGAGTPAPGSHHRHATSMVDDQALVVATLVDGEQLGALVPWWTKPPSKSWPCTTKSRPRVTDRGIQLHAGGDSRWVLYLVARDRLAERFGAAAPEA